MTIWDDPTSRSHEERFFTEIVLPNYTDFLDVFESNSVDAYNTSRLAWNSAISMYHFREHLPNYPTFEEVFNQCHEYGILRDLVLAVKHRNTKISKSGLSKIDFNVGIRLIRRTSSSPARAKQTMPLLGVSIQFQHVLEVVLDYWINTLNVLWDSSMTRGQLIARIRQNRAL